MSAANRYRIDTSRAYELPSDEHEGLTPESVYGAASSWSKARCLDHRTGLAIHTRPPQGDAQGAAAGTLTVSRAEVPETTTWSMSTQPRCSICARGSKNPVTRLGACDDRAD